MSTPNEIRTDIARTRRELSDDVNDLTYEANPKTIARRQVGKVRTAFTDVKDKVMGADDDSSPGSSARSAFSSAGEGISDAASTMSEKVSDAPDMVKARTGGNPLAAGLIAFGIGALIGGLIPASEPEQQAAHKAKDLAEPAVEELKEVAKESVEDLKEPAQQAASSVKDAASDAVDTVKQQGSAAAEDVKAQAQDSTEKVQDSRS